MTEILIDTNVLVYSFHKNEAVKHTIAVRILSHLMNNKQAVVSIQNIVEFSRVLTEKVTPPLDSDCIRQTIDGLTHSMRILRYTPQTIMKALIIIKKYKIHFFDALLIATMEEHFITEIITENEKDFQKYPGIKVTNPFKNI